MNNAFYFRGGLGRGYRRRGGYGWPRRHFWHRRHFGCCGPLFLLLLLAGLVPFAFLVIR